MQPEHERALRKGKCLAILAAQRTQAGKLIKRAPLHTAVPCSLIERIKCGLLLTLTQQCKTKVIVRFAVVGVGIFPCGSLDGGAEIPLALGKEPLVVQVLAVAVIQAQVGGIAAQSFAVIVARIAGGVTVLLQMSGGEE